MALLANNTLASPGLSFYALAGGGGASTLQSPVDIIPEANGNTNVNIVSSTGSGDASLLVSSTNGNAAIVNISNTPGGNAVLFIGQGTAPGGTGSVAIYSPGAIVGGGEINISNANTIGLGADVATFDTINNKIQLGSPASAGVTAIRNGLAIRDEFVVNDPTISIGLTMTSAATGVIAMTSNTGTLNLGSASSNPDIIRLSDGGATDTGVCVIGGNGGENIYMTGGNAVGTVLPNIRTDVPSNGILTLGATSTNALTMFVRDGATADSAYIDVTAGTGAGNAMRITGGQNASLSSNGAGSTLLLTSSVLGGANPLPNSAIKLSATPQSGVLRNSGLQLSDPPSSLLSTEGGSWSSYGILNAQAGGYASPQILDFASLPDGAYFVGSGVTAGQTPSPTDLVILFTFLLYIRNGAITSGGYSVGPTNTYVVLPTSGANVAAGKLQLSWFGGASTSANWNVSAYPINGPIQGMG
jgi:hypothetical protein